MATRILVAGAAGFIGTNFLNRVKNREDFEVIAIYHQKKPSVVSGNIQFIQADLRNPDECNRVMKDIDYVCMFAGRLSTTAVMIDNPLGPVTENTIINTQMLEAAYISGVKKYCWLSSTTGYPKMNGKMKEEDFFKDDPPPPYEPVGWMSRYIEKLAMLYATKPEKPMTVISLRPTSVFGEYDDYNYKTCHALPAIMRRVIERQKPIEIWGSGEDRRDYIYVDDLIDACLLALDKIEGYEAMNIGSWETFSLNELLKYMLEIDEFEDAKITHTRMNKTKVTVRPFDCSYSGKRLDFTAKTSIKDALANTMKWYRETGHTG
ncbi:NAD-dependent epimerase/dehydratase family protein [Candidatus Latescibacterota bacterium]